MGDNRTRRARSAALAAGSLLAGAAAVGMPWGVDTPDNRDWSVDAAPAGHHENSTDGHYDGGAAPAGHIDGG
ncbi:hypothetical protein [Streptomyces sp. WM6386]|uniref:hypothetical protein n=1 Tax=Streptomyces sp. WM6386 TaxID=1415558 RepID=UPI000619F5CB|nr:hypothetical protein [Streptomyces sp. WM6386]KKD08209.1 hypothetical protein TN53_09535 [Streptomyces sp. WM6386]